jgi:hypothetical protein
MSRSFKKPYYTDQQNSCTKFIKRQASKNIRNLRLDQTPKNGKSYKKQFNSWDIRDWSFHSPKDKKAYRK